MAELCPILSVLLVFASFDLFRFSYERSRRKNENETAGLECLGVVKHCIPGGQVLRTILSSEPLGKRL